MNKIAKFNDSNTEKILSVNISTLTKREILKIIALRAREKKRTIIFTPNPQILLSAQKSSDEARLLSSSDLNIPDGIGLVIASRLRCGKIKSRISGIDIAESILALSQKNGYRVFLLGANRGVAKRAKHSLMMRYPRLKICGVHHGYFEKSGTENEKIVKAIRKKSPDIIFVCMGYPTQEHWIINNAPALPSAKILIGLGGSLDVWSGKAKRAPLPLQIIGLEWLYRAIKEPKRIKIFWDIPRFLFEVLR